VSVEVLNFLKKNLGIIIKRLEETGVVILGKDTEGNLKFFSTDAEGRLRIVGEVATEVPNIDVPLSTRASETTLSGIKIQTDKLTFDTENRLKTQLDSIPNPPNLDVALSTRASESTLSGIKSQTDRLQFDANNFLKTVVQNFPTDYFKAGESIGESPFNITKVAGTALTGRDWSGDFAKLQNIDTTLSSRASESTLTAIKSKTDNIDVALSTRASETTLSGIKAQTDKLTFDTANRLAVQNPPNLDVALSTRASESTLSSIKSKTDNIDVALSTRASESTLSGLSSKFPSAAALSDTLSNPTTTVVGAANLGWDGTYWRRLTTDASSRLKVNAEVVANPSNLDVALSTRASESTLSGIKSKTDKLTFDANNRLAIQNPPNLDVALSTRASESTLSGIKAQTDKLTFDAANRLAIQNPPNLDVALSTRASETTLSAIKSKTDNIDVTLSSRLSESTFTSRWDGGIYGFDGTTARKIKTDSAGELQVDVLTIPNPSNLDVALSTRASESTLSAIKSKTDNIDVALSTRASESTLASFVGTPDSSPPTKGVVLLGYDGAYLRRVRTTSDGKLLAVLG